MTIVNLPFSKILFFLLQQYKNLLSQNKNEKYYDIIQNIQTLHSNGLNTYEDTKNNMHIILIDPLLILFIIITYINILYI